MFSNGKKKLDTIKNIQLNKLSLSLTKRCINIDVLSESIGAFPPMPGVHPDRGRGWLDSTL